MICMYVCDIYDMIWYMNKQRVVRLSHTKRCAYSGSRDYYTAKIAHQGRDCANLCTYVRTYVCVCDATCIWYDTWKKKRVFRFSPTTNKDVRTAVETTQMAHRSCDWLCKPVYRYMYTYATILWVVFCFFRHKDVRVWYDTAVASYDYDIIHQINTRDEENWWVLLSLLVV